MAVQYIREKTKQKYYLMAFGVVLIITLVILYFGFFQGKFTFQTQPVATSLPATVRSELKIDFDFLESQELKDMELFESIPAFDGEVGREEPFIKPSGVNRPPVKKSPEEPESESESESEPEPEPEPEIPSSDQ